MGLLVLHCGNGIMIVLRQLLLAEQKAFQNSCRGLTFIWRRVRCSPPKKADKSAKPGVAAPPHGPGRNKEDENCDAP